MNAYTQLTASIFNNKGFIAEATANTVKVSLKNRQVGTLEVMLVIDAEELPIEQNALTRSGNSVIISL